MGFGMSPCVYPVSLSNTPIILSHFLPLSLELDGRALRGDRYTSLMEQTDATGNEMSRIWKRCFLQHLECERVKIMSQERWLFCPRKQIFMS